MPLLRRGDCGREHVIANTDFQLIKIALYLAVIIAALIVLYLNRRNTVRRKVKTTLENYAEYCKQRDKEFPEMVGKWGKP